MGEYYYLIPIDSPHVLLNDVKLSTMFEVAYPDIAELLRVKDALKMNINFEASTYKEVEKKIKRLYVKNNIPKYIIVVEEDGQRRELLTNGVVTTNNEAYFERYLMPLDVVTNYYYNYDNPDDLLAVNYYNKKLSKYYREYLLYNGKNYTMQLKKKND